MSGPLYVAAGGGGDAIMAAVLSRVFYPDQRPTIATFAWDRLMYDPLPGPRTVADFDGLRRLTPLNFAVEQRTRPRPPAGSTLPRLAGDIDAILVLLDPRGGADGLRKQLAELVDYGSHQQVEIVDVGGDAIAEGHEPTLSSPLADALALAATVGQRVAVHVHVAGPGSDGELNQATMRARLRTTNAVLVHRLSEQDAQLVARTLSWHPSEATTMTLAAACGVRGTVEIRTDGTVIDLTEDSANVYRATLADVIGTSVSAEAVMDSTSLEVAEAQLRIAIGFTELDFEHSKAAARAHRVATDGLDPALAKKRIRAYSADARTRGIDYLTFRRLAEVAELTAAEADAMRRTLLADESNRWQFGLWTTT